MFVHAHIFRTQGQDKELINYLKAKEWTSAIIPLHSFLTTSDTDCNPAWLNVTCLISGRCEDIESLLLLHADWKVFASVNEDEYDFDDNDGFLICT